MDIQSLHVNLMKVRQPAIFCDMSITTVVVVFVKIAIFLFAQKKNSKYFSFSEQGFQAESTQQMLAVAVLSTLPRSSPITIPDPGCAWLHPMVRSIPKGGGGGFGFVGASVFMRLRPGW